MKIKNALSGINGEQYFASDLKDANVPQLYGVLIEAKPSCRPLELLVAVRTPDHPTPDLPPEVTLKLGKPFSGRPESNSAFSWEGVATAFTKEPFMLTMETEASKIAGLRTSPCEAVPAKKRARRKGEQ
jgi:hypothetical protein